MSNNDKIYEISIWQNIADENDNLKEKKIAVIGSDTMTSQNRARSPKLISNINGTKTLTFTLYDNYYDDLTGEKTKNLFVPLLVNESLIKLYYDDGESKDKWHDFVIKGIDFNSDSNIYTYTAKDLHINELSKSGFNLVFDDQIENGAGTITELAGAVLSGTNWQAESDTIRQYDIKPLQLATLPPNRSVTFIDALNIDNKKTIASDFTSRNFYVFYLEDIDNNSVINSSKLGCILAEKPGELIPDTTVTLDKQKYPMYRIDENDLEFKIGKPQDDTYGFINPDIENLFAYKLIDSQLTGYDPKLNEYYTAYQKGNNTNYRCYTKPNYVDSLIILDYLSNNKDFHDTVCWKNQDNLNISGIEAVMLPEIQNKKDYISGLKRTSYIKVTNKASNIIYNTSITNKRSTIGNFSKEKKYIFRIKYYELLDNNILSTYPISDSNDINNENRYDIYKETYNGETTSITAKNINRHNFSFLYFKDGYNYYEFSLNESFSQKDMLDFRFLIGIDLSKYISKNQNIAIQEINVFEKIEKNGQLVLPLDKDTVAEEVQGKIITTHYLYDASLTYTDKRDVKYEYIGEKIPAEYIPVSNNYEKKRILRASKSNRFNLIQTLGELFEAYPIFNIEHNPETGEIIKRTVIFKNYINNNNQPLGFTRGINLKSTNRSIISDNITSKLIVPQNSNEFAPNGFCSIANSLENYTKENIIYNFNYYINQNLVDYKALHRYLYNKGYVFTDKEKADLLEDMPTSLGYYKALRFVNTKAIEYIKEIASLAPSLNKMEANRKVYTEAAQVAGELLLDAEAELQKYCGESDPSVVKEDSNYWKDAKFLEIATKIKTQKELQDEYRTDANKAETIYNNSKIKYDNLQEELKKCIKIKTILHDKFFEKFSNIIQEGVWSSEDYFDDNLYYLDASQVALTSAYPKVEYKMDVVDLSSIPEYKYYNFKVGDLSYVEDPEIFGYDIINGVKTPHKEEILISEITRNLDSPESNIITVQNYKTEFQELFHKVVATTQQLQFKEGSYNKASNVVNTDGTLKFDTLQNSINNNNIMIENAKDQTVRWGDDGITVSNLARPNELLRIVSGGIMVSTDGGYTYQAAIRGTGINANYITTGMLNASIVNIVNSKDQLSFRWDEYGINAYDTSNNLNTSQFVRFDQFGIYGITGFSDTKNNNIYKPETFNDIKNSDYSKFGFGWNGFFLKSETKNKGMLEISDTSDITMTVMVPSVSAEGEPILQKITRMQLGRLSSQNNNYGIILRNNEGQTTLETDDSGQLWLQNSLSIGSDLDSNIVKIGNLQENRVFDANDTFVVYRDGTVKATHGKFSGEINATSGTIGSMSVSEDKLTVDGDFVIRKPSTENSPGEILFDYNSTTQSLNIKGNSTFTGVIHGIDGDFTGSISSTSGQIGGFKIENNKLSTDGLVLEAAGFDENNNFVESSITVDNITIGIGAKISKYIQLGKDSYLKNPDENNGVVLESGLLSLNNQGVIQVGNKTNQIKISAEGNMPYIKGNNFTITSDTSVFNNISLTGKIKTAVYEIGKVQAVGGAMIFKPSYIIEKAELKDNKVNFIIDGKLQQNEQKKILVYLVKDGSLLTDQKNTPILATVLENFQEYVAESKRTVDKTKVQIDATRVDTGALNSYSGLIVIGEENKENCLIGVNSESSKTTFLESEGITIATATNTTNSIEYKTNLFIGNLNGKSSQFGFNGLKGYGLYCDNVYLTGSLINKSDDNGYSGINNPTNANDIVFFAGASANTADGMKNAKFKIDRDGNIYTKGSVIYDIEISGGIIDGTDIRGKERGIHLNYMKYEEGIAKDEGIFFDFTPISKTKKLTTTERELIGTNIFKIQSDGLKIDNNIFIQFDDKNGEKQVAFIGQNIETRNLRAKENRSINLISQKLNLVQKDETNEILHMTYEHKTEGCDLYVF